MSAFFHANDADSEELFTELDSHNKSLHGRVFVENTCSSIKIAAENNFTQCRKLVDAVLKVFKMISTVLRLQFLERNFEVVYRLNQEKYNYSD